jgi:hypothetical protein
MADTELGYAPPTVRQFSVFLNNKVGKLLELLRTFDEAPSTRLAAFSIVDSSDYAVVRMIFTNADAARHILRRSQYTFAETDLIIIELGEQQCLSSACQFLLGAELNIRFAYPIMLRGEHPAVAICVDVNHLAGQILLRKRFRLLAEEDLAP